ncbi:MULTISPECIES: hypothetical protein [Prevotellaceae]|uniref:hypothetical protein n=1 Tax=Prevotellaceae TaxID=171552 RepID=UPI0003D2CCE0|nr:hypothetical protein [Prevotella phocaeensis]ETD21435.1 hypothetical protein HMPREF1199_00509 [Hoylesella oralis CC98A]
MSREVNKSPKVALCRECYGTGFQKSSIGGTQTRVRCPQCEGSGRVLVSCKMSLDIRPYKERL